MSVTGFWWFYKVNSESFLEIKYEFERAATEAGSSMKEELASEIAKRSLPLDRVLPFPEGALIGRELSSDLYRESFQMLAYRIYEEEELLTSEDLISTVVTSQILPTPILLASIGEKRFFQLPGFLGNILLSQNEIEWAIGTIDHILDVDQKHALDRGKNVLPYSGDEERAIKDVSEIFEALPSALEQVKLEGSGLLSLVSWDV